MCPELESAALLEPLALARKVADIPGEPALLVGERGTPTEEMARFIHEQSALGPDGRFVVIRCAGVPEELIEAQLFGDPMRPGGVLSQDQPGTVFIDPVSELGASAQARLTASLEREAERRTPPATRVIAGATGDLHAAIRARAFRADLLDLISVVTIRVPPLRIRTNDVERLAVAFARQRSRLLGKKIDGLSIEAIAKLRAYSFPGNERELRGIIERAVIAETGALVSADSLELAGGSPASPEALVAGLSAPLADEVGRPATLAEVERAYIVWMLRYTRGNRTAASRMLGISYPTIAKKIADYNISLETISASGQRRSSG